MPVSLYDIKKWRRQGIIHMDWITESAELVRIDGYEFVVHVSKSGSCVFSPFLSLSKLLFSFELEKS